MTLSFTTFLIVCPLVFLAGFIDSIAGGGGLISLPAYLIAGLPPHFAIATNKLSSFMGVSLSTGRFFKNKMIDLKLALPSMALALAGSAVGARLILLVSGEAVKYLLLAALPVIAFFMLRKKDLDAHPDSGISPRKQYLIVLSASLFIGAYDGFYGPGTGTFLLIIYSQLAKMPLRLASGNVKAVNFASNLGSLAVFILNGRVICALGLVAGIFSLLGNYIGSGMVLKNGSKIVRPVIVAVLALLFLKLLLGS